MSRENVIVGRNPVTEALKSGREIDKLMVSAEDGSMKKIWQGNGAFL